MIDQIGQPPALAYDGLRWWDLRPRDPATLAALGWQPVTDTVRPPDTDTTTADRSVALVGGIPTETWTARLWTAAELSTRARDQVAATLAADALSDEVKIEKAIAKLATLLGAATVPGSIRATIGPDTATAGTTSLRALKAQSNTAVVTAASIKALIGLTIDALQLVIDETQATRRIARQTLRLARLQTGNYASADVGTDI